MVGVELFSGVVLSCVNGFEFVFVLLFVVGKVVIIGGGVMVFLFLIVFCCMFVVIVVVRIIMSRIVVNFVSLICNCCIC